MEDRLERTLEYGRLLDFYAQLLTRRQAEAAQLFYEENLSLAEIAAELKISRQAVHEAVKHASQALRDYESKLALAARFRRLQDVSEQLALRIDPRDAEALRLLDALRAEL